MRIGANGNEGDLIVRDASGREIFHVDGGGASLRLGTTGNAAELSIRDTSDREVLQFDSTNAVLRVGANGNEGDIIVRDSSGREVFHVDGNGAILRLGTAGNPADLSIRDGSDREVLQFDSVNAVMRIGASGNEGDLIVRDASGREVFHFDAGNAVLRVGADGNEGDVILRDAAGNESIHLDGGSGDIILRNADLAEQFDVAEAVEAAPGTLMALAQDGRLMPTAAAYERAVVGVVAGGGRFRPGIVMDHRAPGPGRRLPIAMVGKAACRVDAGHGAVRVGDLLTSSPTPGCAMRAADPALAFGAVIGKALTPLDEGTGLVEMIISLQ